MEFSDEGGILSLRYLGKRFSVEIIFHTAQISIQVIYT
jgi:hypothetical protein